jgi:hypothetical protein
MPVGSICLNTFEPGEYMRSKQLGFYVVLGVLIAVSQTIASGQNPANNYDSEQTSFNAEPDSAQALVNRPVRIPDSALQVLRDTLTGGTFNCLKSHEIEPDEAPASWFLASEIHLNGPKEVDLIVLPNATKIADPSNPGGCLLAAHGGRFWVLGPGVASGRYELLLQTYGLALKVLNSRTNRYRDLQVAEESRNIIYRFTLQQYQRAEIRTEQ